MDQLCIEARGAVTKAPDMVRVVRVGVNWDEPITAPERLTFCLNPFGIFFLFQEWSVTLLSLNTQLISQNWNAVTS